MENYAERPLLPVVEINSFYGSDFLFVERKNKVDDGTNFQNTKRCQVYHCGYIAETVAEEIFQTGGMFSKSFTTEKMGKR